MSDDDDVPKPRDKKRKRDPSPGKDGETNGTDKKHKSEKRSKDKSKKRSKGKDKSEKRKSKKRSKYKKERPKHLPLPDTLKPLKETVGYAMLWAAMDEKAQIKAVLEWPRKDKADCAHETKGEEDHTDKTRFRIWCNKCGMRALAKHASRVPCTVCGQKLMPSGECGWEYICNCYYKLGKSPEEVTRKDWLRFLGTEVRREFAFVPGDDSDDDEDDKGAMATEDEIAALDSEAEAVVVHDTKELTSKPEAPSVEPEGQEQADFRTWLGEIQPNMEALCLLKRGQQGCEHKLRSEPGFGDRMSYEFSCEHCPLRGCAKHRPVVPCSTCAVDPQRIGVYGWRPCYAHVAQIQDNPTNHGYKGSFSEDMSMM